MIGMTKIDRARLRGRGHPRLRRRAGLHRLGDDRGISAGPRRRADRRRHPARPRRHRPTRSPKSSAGWRSTRRRRRPAASSTSMARAMFASLLLLAAAQLGQHHDPASEDAAAGRAAHRADRDRGPGLWSRRAKVRTTGTKPAPPVRIFGNTYFVGTCGISSILITSAARAHPDRWRHGGRAPTSSPHNIQRPRLPSRQTSKIILHSHEHFDHVGGIARLQQLTGAQRLCLAGRRGRC